MGVATDGGSTVVEAPLKRKRGRGGGFKWLSWAKRGVTLALILSLWQLLVSGGIVDEVIVPGPVSVWNAIWEILPTRLFGGHLLSTLGNTLAGYAVGIAVGLGLALALVLWEGLRPFLYDYIVGFEAIPKVTLVPVLVTWFGFGATSKIVLAALITFWPVFLTSYTGMRNVDQDALKLMASLRATRYQTLRMLRFPGALPTIFAGLRNGMTNALIGAVLAELFGARVGIGYLITTYNFSLRIANVFAVIFAISAVAVLLLLILDVVARRVAFWAEN